MRRAAEEAKSGVAGDDAAALADLLARVRSKQAELEERDQRIEEQSRLEAKVREETAYEAVGSELDTFYGRGKSNQEDDDDQSDGDLLCVPETPRPPVQVQALLEQAMAEHKISDDDTKPNRKKK